MMQPEFQNTLKDIFEEERKALPLKTLRYWKLQRCWNGIDIDKKMTVSKALGEIHSIRSQLNPQRPLNIGLEHLKEQIVEHGCKPTTKKTSSVRIVVL